MLVSALHTPSILRKPSSATGLRKVCQVQVELIPVFVKQGTSSNPVCGPRVEVGALGFPSPASRATIPYLLQK